MILLMFKMSPIATHLWLDSIYSGKDKVKSVLRILGPWGFKIFDLVGGWAMFGQLMEYVLGGLQ